MTQKKLREVWITRIKDDRSSGWRVATWCERHEVTPRPALALDAKIERADEQKPATSKPQWAPIHMD
ncbi:hypothetical protein [Brevibacillus sp. H7]|uniref:hypothetical protein n=1 Tax=Brevibacillus sp. H7 TaxID=3349138 RepID=UPI00380FC73B